MTIQTLASILEDMYVNAPKGEKSTMVHLFGIVYAKEIKTNKIKISDLLKTAKITKSYNAEIRKGIRVGKYVKSIKCDKTIIKFPI